MYQSLHDFLEINLKPSLASNFIFINWFEEEGSFLINHFISQYIKNDCGVCLITCDQTLSHYVNIANKSSVNLKISQEREQFFHVNLIQYFFEVSLKELTQYCNVQKIKDLVSNYFEKLKGDGKIIIVDDFSLLLSIGFNYVQILSLIIYLKELVGVENYLVLSFKSSERCSEELKALIKDLRYQCDIFLQCQPLKTGFCKEVTGKITIIKKCDNQEVYKPPITKHAHYKLSDRNIIILPIGLSEAVV